MGLADQIAMREKPVELPLDDAGLPGRRAPAGAGPRPRATNWSARACPAQHRCGPSVHVRYEGTDTALVVPHGTTWRRSATSRRRTASVTLPDAGPRAGRRGRVGGGGERRPSARRAAGRRRAGAPRAAADASVQACSAGAGWRRASTCASRCSPAQSVAGPAVIAEANATTVVEPGWQAVRHRGEADGADPRGAAPDAARHRHHADPVMLEVFNNLFMSIAEQMGCAAEHRLLGEHQGAAGFLLRALRRRRQLIANAPHMPVHLGSMGESVKTVIARNAGQMQPGDVYVLNAPYNGGTHLPDVTVVTPVFDEAGRREALLLRRLRGHHADIGGITPGSMPPFSKRRRRRRAARQRPAGARGGFLREADPCAPS
jgi:5-oxoprolinase (ATP-hydrolysing)